MKKSLVCLTLLSLSSLVLAEAETNAVKSIDIRTLSKEQRRALMLEYSGGFVGKPGSAEGCISIVNCQKRIPAKWLSDVADMFNANFRNKIRFEFQISSGSFQFPNPEIKGQAALFVVDDEKLPSLLSAPENRWSMINIFRLNEGDGNKPQFFEARVKKSTTRALCLLAGAQDSAYPRCLLGCKTRASDLDINPDCRLPVDVLKRFEKYLEGYGIKPEIIKTYRKACEEGWAPAPTNTIQKAVWDEIHESPTNPIKIQFDPKTDTK